MPVDTQKLAVLENRILDSKTRLAKISDIRWRALLEGDYEAALKARVRAVDESLEECGVIAEYVKVFSAPLAREISYMRDSVFDGFWRIRFTNDQQLLHDWVKVQLVPLMNRSERLAHAVASSSGKMRGLEVDLHRWTASKPISPVLESERREESRAH